MIVTSQILRHKIIKRLLNGKFKNYNLPGPILNTFDIFDRLCALLVRLWQESFDPHHNLPLIHKS